MSNLKEAAIAAYYASQSSFLEEAQEVVQERLGLQVAPHQFQFPVGKKSEVRFTYQGHVFRVYTYGEHRPYLSLVAYCPCGNREEDHLVGGLADYGRLLLDPPKVMCRRDNGCRKWRRWTRALARPFQSAISQLPIPSQP